MFITNMISTPQVWVMFLWAKKKNLKDLSWHLERFYITLQEYSVNTDREPGEESEEGEEEEELSRTPSLEY